MIEETCWGWLPAVLFSSHDACGVVLSEGSFGKLGDALSGADRLESFVSLLCSVDTAVLEHELVC